MVNVVTIPAYYTMYKGVLGMVFHSECINNPPYYNNMASLLGILYRIANTISLLQHGLCAGNSTMNIF